MSNSLPKKVIKQNIMVIVLGGGESNQLLWVKPVLIYQPIKRALVISFIEEQNKTVHPSLPKKTQAVAAMLFFRALLKKDCAG